MNYSSIRWSKLVGPLLAVILLTAACSGADAETSDGVATLETTEETDEQALGADGAETGDPSGEGSGDADGGAATTEEAALQFAECMRDQGLDFPDPTVDADGNPSFDDAIRAAADGGLDLRSEESQAALDACRDLTEGFTFGRGGAGFDRTAFEDALLPYTQCLRDEGLDVGDVSLDGGGAGAGAGNGQAAGGDGEGTGRPAGGQRGDLSGRIAAFLGLDTEDPTTEAALETCLPLLEEAVGTFGPGSGGDDQ